MVSEKDFIPGAYPNMVDQGVFEWAAPSNIALVKYWGKKNNQIPANPSVSFTLQHCKTITKLSFEKKTDKTDFSFVFLFEGMSKPSFEPKIAQFFRRIAIYLPFLTEYHFVIDSRNTFPHSSGIASSASGMAALAMNLMSVERLLQPEMTDDYFYQKASFLARLGSGSACRSIRGNAVIWGAHNDNDTGNSSDLFGVPFTDLHPVFQDYQDTILLVDKGEKQVSSTVGHDLMNNHPYAVNRFTQAHHNLTAMKSILKSGDLTAFVALVESEALTLHAMMMTSMPYFILMKPATLEIIQLIWQFRNTTNIPVCFTLDAGANVHVLYPQKDKEAVLQFVKNELVGFCQNSQYICDQIGVGAVLLDE